MRTGWILKGIVFALSLSGFKVVASEQIVIDSWRNDDKVWNEVIIPAFNKHYPNIKVTYRASASPAIYNGELENRLENGSAGDLIACRPFDSSLKLFKEGNLKEITEMPGMENFPSFAQTPWQTDSGAQTFCLPVASVIHGFFYNRKIFRELGLSKPKTRSEFHAVLESAKAAGYTALALGTKDKWEAATMGFQNIGPNYWLGEDGRFALINGDEKLNSQPYMDTFAELQSWKPYMGQGFEKRSYEDSIKLFKSGRAAIYPAGSWDITTFGNTLELGVFPPPVPDSAKACYFSDHTDIGMGINAKSKHPDAAAKFLSWMTTEEFAELFTNGMPGFFSLSNHFFDVTNPVAAEMLSWRDRCDSTIRNTAQILSRGKPDLELGIWEASTKVIEGKLSPWRASRELQEGLESWYPPQKNAQSSEKAQDWNCPAVN
ncbi:extracellular solute-binding protein [Parasalinivibrio latis]|uniref:ABC transporter substrate-binding protein n=1 Tax=Parasalinivibrio latis TaxID=2952610 RepID=UPI0030E16BDB